MEIRKGFVGMKAIMVMVLVQLAYAVMNIVYKLVEEDGMNLSVLVAYRMMFAASLMIPLALIFERKHRPKLTWMILFQAFCCGFFGGTLAQNLYIQGLALTSATFSIAMTNLIPATTFLTAICFRVEEVVIGTTAGKAKVVGTVVGIGGAMLLTLYKGMEMKLWSTNVNLLFDVHCYLQRHPKASHGRHSRLILGPVMIFGSSVSYSLWLILQGKMSKRYPCNYSSIALMSMMGLLQSLAYALFTQRNWTEWKLGFNIRLLAAAYSGIVGSGIVVILITWCIRLRGPIFVSSFYPLGMVVVAIIGSLVLDEKFYLGSFVGGIVIASGLYMVLWGKRKEAEREALPCKEQIVSSTSKSCVH